MGYFEGTSTYDDDNDGDDDDRSRYQSSLPLIKMPWVAPTEVPTMIAVGVARPRAHGQDTTTTLLI